jgi:hypothetical protein
LSFCNNIWSWAPWALPLAGSLFMLLLILLFGPCIINALFRFISQQVQWIKFQLLVKEYSLLPTHKPSVQFPGGLWRVHRSAPETSTTPLTPLLPIVSRKQIDESSPLCPTAVGYLSQRGDLLVWEPKRQMSESVSHPPWRAL